MRESLGWITNCTHAEQCPQNWLELSVSELPRAVACHVCGRQVDLSEDEARFQAACGQGLAAWPVVPPVAVGAARPTEESAMPEGDAGPVPQVEVRPAPVPASKPAASGRGWYVWLDSGERLSIDKDHMVIGRSRNCDIILPSAKVSRQHATLTMDDGELFIEDLGSANGLWKNGQRIEKDKIASGDIVVVSDETLRFEAR
jgi:hypothetical protein